MSRCHKIRPDDIRVDLSVARLPDHTLKEDWARVDPISPGTGRQNQIGQLNPDEAKTGDAKADLGVEYKEAGSADDVPELENLAGDDLADMFPKSEK